MTGQKGWIDISIPLRTGMVHWPDDPPVKIERTLDLVLKQEFGSSRGLIYPKWNMEDINSYACPSI